MRKLCTVLLTLFLTVQLSFGQKSYADKLYDEKEYGKAANMYEKVIEKGKEKDMLSVIERAAKCFKYVNNYEKAEKYYGMAVQMEGASPDSYLNYGQLLKNSSKISQAKINFQKFLELEPYDTEGEAMLESCDRIIEWASEPTEFQIENIEEINTASSEIGPFPMGDKLVYTSDKNYQKKNKKGEFDVTMDNLAYAIYTYEEGVEEPIKPLEGNINTLADVEGPAYFNREGTKMVYVKVIKRASREVNQLELHMASLVGGKWQKNDSLILENKEHSFNNPVFSPDMSRVYFSSDKLPTTGGFDIFYSLISTNKFGRPVNLGNVVNTEGNELPCYVDDNGTLYFSSDQHPGYGGFDIFKTSGKDTKWSTPENIKLPFNSNKDDFYYMPVDANTGYLASNRDGGKGLDDIYKYSRISFSDKTKYAEICGVYELAGSPISGVHLSLLDAHEQIVQTSITNEKGEFNFKNVSSDKDYHILIDEDPKSVSDEAKIRIVCDDAQKKQILERLQNGLFKFRVLSHQEADDLSTIPEFDDNGLPTVVIMGQLSSASGNDMSNKKVFVVDRNGNTIASAFTNHLGQFKFEKLSMDDEYLFKLEETDFDINIEIIDKDGKLVGKTMKNKDGEYVYHKFWVNRSGKPDIRGVFKFGNLPADGVTLYLIDENDATLQFVKTGANGEFEFNNLEAGKKYSIKPENAEQLPDNSQMFLVDSYTGFMMPVSKLANGSFEFETLSPMSADELELMDEVDYELTPRSHLIGQVINKETKDLPANLDIEILDENGQIIAVAKTNGKGEFRFYNLPLDDQYLFSIKEDDPNFEIRILSDDNKTIGIAEKNDQNLYVYHKFTINPSGNPDIRGIFKYGNLPANDITLNLLDEEDNILSFTKTDKNGEFEFKNLKAGTEYRVAVDESKSGPVPDNANMLIQDQYTGLMLPVSKLANGKFKFETLPEMEAEDIALMEEEDVSIPRFAFSGMVYSKLPFDVPEGFEIYILDDEGNIIATATANHLGKFNYSELPLQDEYIMKLSEDDPNLVLKIMDDEGNEIGSLNRDADGTYRYNPKELAATPKHSSPPPPSITSNDVVGLSFDQNSSWLNSAQMKELDIIIEELNNDPQKKVEVSSHTDANGTKKYNNWLSERRANSIKKYMVEKGIAENRIDAKFYGEDRLLNDCTDGVDCPDEKHAENRRTEFRYY